MRLLKFLKKPITKIFVVIFVCVIFSLFGFTMAFGYGGGHIVVRPILGEPAVEVLGGNTTFDRHVTLRFNVDKATYVVISEKSFFEDASWQVFEETKGVVLSESFGKKTLYFKFLSASGGEAVFQIEVNYNAPMSEYIEEVHLPSAIFSPKFRLGLTEKQKQEIVTLIKAGRIFSEIDARNLAYSIQEANWQQYVDTSIISTHTKIKIKEATAPTEIFFIKLRPNLIAKQKQEIINLINSGHAFSVTDAQNYAYATMELNWQKFVGTNPKDSKRTVAYYWFDKLFQKAW